MNQERRIQAERLTDALELSMPPIAIAFPDVVPEGVPEFGETVPAGCVFWERAAERSFATAAGHHALCSIGVHTHNLAGAPASHPGELRVTLEAMVGLDYVREEEVAALPVLAREAEHVVYGPLHEFPLDPEVVLVFADARRSLVLSEAVTRVDGGVAPAMGRPACAAVPHAVNGGTSVMSLGCCGARAYLGEFADDVALWALPGSRIPEYCDQTDAFASANRTLATFHERRKADVESGGRPTVRESLARLS